MSKALVIRNLSKQYSNGTKALVDVNLEIEKGDFFGLLGPNGAGKTTTIEIISSITKKTSGTILIDGIDIDNDFEKAKSRIGLVPQEFNCNYFETVWDIIIKQAGFYGILPNQAKDYAEFLLKKLKLTDKKDTICRKLSGGMKRRLMIARGMIHKPSILILDEPTAGVDVELRREMLKFIKEINNLGTTVILTTHYLEEAEELCKNLAILNKGKIAVNTSVKSIVEKLNKESFILDLSHKIEEIPNSLKQFDVVKISTKTIEVTISKDQTLNDVFDVLNKYDIRVQSLKNKTNRLEEFFINLAGQN
jgi:ABC-2 type transport system ATP-binding protein